MVAGPASSHCRSSQTWNSDATHVFSGPILFAQRWKRKCAPGPCLVAPYKGSPYRIGYFSITKLAGGTPFLPTISTTGHKLHQTEAGGAVARALCRYLGRVCARLYAACWCVLLCGTAPKQEVRTHTYGLVGEGIRVIRRWTSMVAEQYYRLAHRADPRGRSRGAHLWGSSTNLL